MSGGDGAHRAPPARQLRWALAAAVAGCSDPAPPGFRPEMSAAAIERDGHLECSAVLVDSTTVVTAWHCLARRPPPQVFLGIDPLLGGTRVAAASFAPVAGFDPLRGTPDVAVISLARPLSGEPYVPAPRAPWSAIRPGVRATIVGFGHRHPALTDGHVLHYMTMRVTEVSDHLVVLQADPDGVCEGDSGAGVFVGGSLAGVISSGAGGCSDVATAEMVDSVP